MKISLGSKGKVKIFQTRNSKELISIRPQLQELSKEVPKAKGK
jgi:hypothetical protein